MSDLPSNWSETTFGEVIRNVSINDKKLPRKQYAETGAFPVVDQGQEFIGGYSDDESRVVADDLPLLIFGDHTRIFKFLNQPFVPGADGIKVLKPQGVDEKWLYHIAHALEFPDKGYARHFHHLKKARLLVPPLPEQRRIVARIEELFSRLDAGVAALRHAKAQLQRYRQSVLAAAVTGQLTQAWREQHPDSEPASALLERVLDQRRKKWKGKGKYKDPSPLAEGVFEALPQEWAIASLEALTDANRPICYGILMPKDNVPDGVLYVKVRDMRGDRISLESLQRTTPEIAAKYERASLKEGDLLLSIRGTYGRVALIPPELDGGNITQDSARLAVSELLSRDYVACAIRSHTVQTHFKKVARGVAVKGVNIGDVKPTPIPIPPLAEQHQIVAEVEARTTAIDHLEAELDRQITRSNRLRQSSLAAAYSGSF